MVGGWIENQNRKTINERRRPAFCVDADKKEKAHTHTHSHPPPKHSPAQNVAVLPVPDCACWMTSRPLAKGTMPFCWMADGFSKPYCGRKGRGERGGIVGSRVFFVGGQAEKRSEQRRLRPLPGPRALLLVSCGASCSLGPSLPAPRSTATNARRPPGRPPAAGARDPRGAWQHARHRSETNRDVEKKKSAPAAAALRRPRPPRPQEHRPQRG